MFDTNSRFLRSNAKPNGSAPLVGLLIAGPVVPSELTLNVVSWPGGGMTSVTTSVLPVLSNPMLRAAVPGGNASGLVELAIADMLPLPLTRMPEMLALPTFST